MTRTTPRRQDHLPLVVHQDDAGWFIGYLKPDGTYGRRSLSTPHRVRALLWWNRAKCHGFSHHHVSCHACRYLQASEVMTPLGPGTVCYVRMWGSEIEAVSVLLDSKRDRLGYAGTIFKASDVDQLPQNRDPEEGKLS